jgi:hypothetical protein
MHGVAAVIVLTAAIYLSSGTMAPYAATDSHPLVLEPCHYLVNVDHYHFEAVYRMIRGEEPSRWTGSVVLRRLLFPVIAYPLVMAAGFLAGGLMASILLNVAAIVIFGRFVRQRIGERAAIATLWLLATYPGITYWAGLPYSYVAIVPGSLFGLILLYRVDDRPSLTDAIRSGFLLGLIFVAYDLFAFFGPAAVLLLAWRRRWRAIVPVVLGMAVPGILVAGMFAAMGVSLLNSNTANFLSVIFSYFNYERYDVEWISYLLELPLVLLSNAVYGNLVFLPFLGAVGALMLWKQKLNILALPEKTLLVAGILLFFFTNAAPPYYGWQMRGYWLARLYQPLVVVLLMVAARASQNLDSKGFRQWSVALVAAILLNASVAFGPVLMNPLAEFVYHRFYIHTPSESLLTNLQRYGRRPLGFCNPSHEWDSIKSPKTPLNRPSYMYRYPVDVNRQQPTAGTTRR